MTFSFVSYSSSEAIEVKSGGNCVKAEVGAGKETGLYP